MFTSAYEIPQILASESASLSFVLHRLEVEQFEYVKSLEFPAAKPTFRTILSQYFEGTLDMEQVVMMVETKIQTPIDYRRIERWAERLLRTEASKIFMLGYGDYLLDLGEELCYVPHTPHDESDACARVLAGKTFKIREIQGNVYANYGLGGKSGFPTVPLHANCRHIIRRVRE